MSLTMSKQERETYLSGLHVGIISIGGPEKGPLTVPVWYGYEPGGNVWVFTGPESLKFKRIKAAMRFSLCVQTETPPYQYVSVEGPVVEIVEADIDVEMRAMAHRYYGAEGGDNYIDTYWKDAGPGASMKISMKPETWYTADYGERSL